jgi:hypothetical protein
MKPSNKTTIDEDTTDKFDKLFTQYIQQMSKRYGLPKQIELQLAALTRKKMKP